jgi:hypothetical protein
MFKTLSLLTALVMLCAAAPAFAKENGSKQGKSPVVAKMVKAVPTVIASKAKAPKSVVAAKKNSPAPKQVYSSSNRPGKNCIKGTRGTQQRNSGAKAKVSVKNMKAMKHQRR